MVESLVYIIKGHHQHFHANTMWSALTLEARTGSLASRLNWNMGLMSSYSQAGLNVHPAAGPLMISKVGTQLYVLNEIPQEYYLYHLLPHSGCPCPSGSPIHPFFLSGQWNINPSKSLGFINQKPGKGLRQIYI